MLTKRDPYDRLEHLDAMSAIKAWLLGDYCLAPVEPGISAGKG